MSSIQSLNHVNFKGQIKIKFKSQYKILKAICQFYITFCDFK